MKCDRRSVGSKLTAEWKVDKKDVVEVDNTGAGRARVSAVYLLESAQLFTEIFADHGNHFPPVFSWNPMGFFKSINTNGFCLQYSDRISTLHSAQVKSFLIPVSSA